MRDVCERVAFELRAVACVDACAIARCLAGVAAANAMFVHGIANESKYRIGAPLLLERGCFAHSVERLLTACSRDSSHDASGLRRVRFHHGDTLGEPRLQAALEHDIGGYLFVLVGNEYSAEQSFESSVVAIRHLVEKSPRCSCERLPQGLGPDWQRKALVARGLRTDSSAGG